MFFSYLENIADLESRQLSIINHISDYFTPTDSNKYFIMDPYLNPVDSLQQPFRERKLESTNWSFLLAELAAPKCEFFIFTAASINGLTAVEKEPPYEISSDNQLVGTKVYVCQYPGNAYNGLNIHDRYIIQKNQLDTKGLHIGPSLDDIHNKDVSLTMFSKYGAEKALNNFESLWTECIRTKAWKKG